MLQPLPQKSGWYQNADSYPTTKPDLSLLLECLQSLNHCQSHHHWHHEHASRKHRPKSVGRGLLQSGERSTPSRLAKWRLLFRPMRLSKKLKLRHRTSARLRGMSRRHRSIPIRAIVLSFARVSHKFGFGQYKVKYGLSIAHCRLHQNRLHLHVKP